MPELPWASNGASRCPGITVQASLGLRRCTIILKTREFIAIESAVSERAFVTNGMGFMVLHLLYGPNKYCPKLTSLLSEGAFRAHGRPR